jgi:hypothetical protein
MTKDPRVPEGDLECEVVLKAMPRRSQTDLRPPTTCKNKSNSGLQIKVNAMRDDP